MNISLILGALLISTLGLAQEAVKPICWKSELNYRTSKKYTSYHLYQSDVKSWDQQMGTVASPFALSKAYMVYKSEEPVVKLLKKDKVKHCYLGCRIAKETDYETSRYVAWLKEKEDLTDCKLSSRFELADYDATIDGAKKPANQTVCREYCVKQWKK